METPLPDAAGGEALSGFNIGDFPSLLEVNPVVPQPKTTDVTKNKKNNCRIMSVFLRMKNLNKIYGGFNEFIGDNFLHQN
ncbi:MAG: hypothetical protein A2031_05730 [Deltaproteobacteria bacterium RBG_19FT_COMBO_43_11]|nr:MAG: hypothetical protein A2W27_01495 [Deltaproteobacteria bacterium RBG_16_44_11]OGP91088.1 MAG: hypothetical protein A2031_05730 [Deltaproteobacteria bacterium RBG_19FT_COMBO_43_11]